ncbi:hypothetical protein C8Q76DRAFT_634071 [Earliella scabrosa]|nr:hypothetical protein C8Q76DRAFT_634071 [Earliella scabrosa]
MEDNHVTFTADSAAPKRSRRLHPDDAANKLYSAWLTLMPSLVPNYLAYLQTAQKRVGGGSSYIPQQRCITGTCMLESCPCAPLPHTLIGSGLFPTSPSQPRVAVSIDLLDFYFALFERSADAVTALAGALKALYQRRGFPILNDKGEPIQDPFRRGLGYAIQWYDCLRNRVESLVESAVDDCLETIKAFKASHSLESEDGQQLELFRESAPPKLASGSCDRILQKRCPACFGGTKFGRGFDTEGGDVHVAIDATFSQRHNVAAGDSPWFHEPKYFISKEAVDAVGSRITEARKSAPRRHASQVPDHALDECEKSFEAADEQKAKTSGTKFDDTGLMALVCRHDIVLFLANVDTPGEQQKYGIALIEHLASLLPPTATLAVFYDIGCVLDRSLHLYDILPHSLVERLVFATSVMHAYGHQWSCQLVYNPRLREGLGLTEGEGTERVWSKFRKLIGVTRTSGRSRRIWYLDRHADSVNLNAREDLGSWLRSRLKNGVEARTAKAEQELLEIRIPTSELRHQWQLQRSAQLSVKNHAPTRLKKELDTVLNLQAELDDIKKYVSNMRSHIESEDTNPEAHHFLRSLQQSHARTIEQVEALYASLNVPEDFPELQGLSLPFIRTLIMARDLKINIRKRAIGSFFEWDKLDRAAGGRDQPLGTKLHQQTRKAISKRTPALLTAIRKFNTYCDALKREHKKGWKIPLPTHLPVELGALRNDPSLLTDVWVTPVATPAPRWMDEPDVRRGIRAMLSKDRCLEERRRLGNEADNLCRWYGDELAAVELALRTPRFSTIAFLLQQRKAELLLLQARWRTPLASELRFIARTEEATSIAERLSGASSAQALTWVHLAFHDGQNNDDRPDPEDSRWFDPEVIIVHDALAELVGDDDDEDPDDGYSGTGAAASFPTITSPDRSMYSHSGETRLRNPTGWLNDNSVNACAQLLSGYFGTENVTGGRPAILSSFAMAQQRDGTSLDDGMWRVNHRSRYWEKDVWIIPIHQPSTQHWELAIVYLRQCRIAYFDSLAHPKTWEEDVQTVFGLIHRLQRLATERGNRMTSLDGEWCAFRLLNDPLQTNGHDCGVWVLACIASLLRGFECVSCSELDIGRFRSRLLTLVLQNTHPE